MAETTTETIATGAAAANADTDYERRDLPVGTLILAALGTALFVALSPFVMLRSFPAAVGDVDRSLHEQPPAPRLQLDPQRDLQAYLGRQQALLGSYGWIDRGRGIAHVPIAIAMQRLPAQGAEGFPRAARADPAAPTQAPTPAPAPAQVQGSSAPAVRE